MIRGPMSELELDAWVGLFAAIAPDEIARFFPTPNNCIAAVRILEQVFLKAGVQVRVIPCRYICEGHGRAYVAGPRDPEWDGKFAANVPLSLDLRKDGWQGHLIALAGRWLIDPTWTAAAPFIGFPENEDRCLALAMPPEYDPKLDSARLDVETASGQFLRLRYEPVDDHGYLETPAWELDHLEPAIGLIWRRMTGQGPQTFHQYVVYRRPRDFPMASIVVRRWRLEGDRCVPDAKPALILAGPDELALAFARKRLEEKGLIRWERFAHDDPAIVEVWF